jgi:hypothetical protein
LGAERLDEARADYEELLKTPRHARDALFGLGGIAWRRRDTNAAVGYYQQYVSNAAPDSPQLRLVAQRLKQLKNGQAP